MYTSYVIIASDMPTLGKLCNSFFLAALQMKCVEYMIYLQIIYDIIHRIHLNLENIPKDTIGCWSIVQRLIKCQQQLNKTWFLVERLDRYFAAPIFLLFLHNGLCIVYTVNWAYLRIIYEPKYTTQTLRYSYIFILFLNIFLVCYFAEKCVDKMVLMVFAFIVILIQFKMEDVSLGALCATQKLFGLGYGKH
ncbi:putative gustatory receptor 98c [Musca vetustissima]|uniref:putative gustatory receptor 98c n=1 Tax=Musca vetustissima TaxID=27455 RepID=UPI002AB79106|nr:putative gustatory receptor 98c [Musca vetustissima]